MAESLYLHFIRLYYHILRGITIQIHLSRPIDSAAELQLTISIIHISKGNMLNSNTNGFVSVYNFVNNSRYVCAFAVTTTEDTADCYNYCSAKVSMCGSFIHTMTLNVNRH